MTSSNNDKFTFVWNEISVEVCEKRTRFWRTQASKKAVLKCVSGSVCSRKLVAIMGESGSGKTTFLSAISGRNKLTMGSLFINYQAVTAEYIKSISGFIHQQDLFTESLTVNEHLNFVAAMQLAIRDSTIREDIINKYTRELNLEGNRNSLIKYLSGGQRRRLALAAELLSDPLILFCDEPTTGLDSYSAIIVVEMLQNIANIGSKLILTTIHQPSSQIFALFDTIVLLAGGQLVCQGSKEEIYQFFTNINLRCPANYNPADHYLKCVTIPSCDQRKTILVNEMVNLYDQQRGEDGRSYHLKALTDVVRSVQKKSNNSYLNQFKWLLWRNGLDVTRQFRQHLIHYMLLMISTLTITLTYSYVKLRDLDSVQNIQGVLLLIVSELTFTSMYAVIYVFPGETAIYLRESHLYSILSYFISKLLSVIPLCLINSISYLIVYFITLDFLNGYELFFNMFYVLFCTCLASCALGLSFSATVTQVEYVDLIIVPIEMIVMIMSGIWIKIDSLPSYLMWIKYSSPFFYSFQSMSVLYWRDVTHLSNCTGDELTPCYRDGQDVLRTYGFNKNYNVVAFNIFYLHILIIAYSLLGLVGIVRKKRYTAIL